MTHAQDPIQVENDSTMTDNEKIAVIKAEIKRLREIADSEVSLGSGEAARLAAAEQALYRLTR